MVEISGIPWVEKTSFEDPVYSDGETCCRYGGETVDGVVVFGCLSNEIYIDFVLELSFLVFVCLCLPVCVCNQNLCIFSGVRIFTLAVANSPSVWNIRLPAVGQAKNGRDTFI